LLGPNSAACGRHDAFRRRHARTAEFLDDHSHGMTLGSDLFDDQSMHRRSLLEFADEFIACIAHGRFRCTAMEMQCNDATNLGEFALSGISQCSDNAINSVQPID
jgi:hypothetical protein